MIKNRAPLVFVLVALLGISGCVSFMGPSQQARREAAAKILEVYALPAMLEQVAPVIANSLRMNLPSSVSEAAHERLVRAIEQVYASEALLAAMNRRLRKKAAVAGRVGVLINAAEKLDSKLAKHMIALERKAGTEAFTRGYRKFLQQPLSQEDKQRLAMTRRLLDAMGLVDLQVTLQVGMLKGMVAARNAVVKKDMETDADMAQRMAEMARKGLRQSLLKELPLMLLYAYRSVSNEKLDRYLALHNSPSLAWVNEAIPEVLGSVLRAASKRLAERYAALRVANEQTGDA